MSDHYQNRDKHPKHKPHATAAPPQEPPQKCARCGSGDTKFCYYNNYSLSQPRYFCRECRRYWTRGGSLRKVPIGGRRGKRSRTAAATSSSSQQQLGMRVPELGQCHFPGGGGFLGAAFPTVPPLMSLAPPRLTTASLGIWEGLEANLWRGSGAAGNTSITVKTEPTSSAPSAANSTQWFGFPGFGGP